MDLSEIKILFIGAGNMGQAIMKGVVNKELLTPGQIAFYDPNEDIAESLVNDHGFTRVDSFNNDLSEYNFVILAVKPQVFKKFNFNQETLVLKDNIHKNQVVISVMAGISIANLQDFFYNCNQVIRVMPNTPALIGEGMNVISPSEMTDEENIDIVRTVFNAVGETLVVDQSYMDAVTGLSGSGPAYVFLFLESMIQGGVLCGLSKDNAEKLAVQTMLGAVKMAKELKETDNLSIEDLRHMVTSPGGTTIEALNHFENSGIRGTIADAVRKSANRSKELSN